MLVAWMSNNKTKTWSEGLRFIQSKKNRAPHSGIKTSPYEAVFWTAQRIGHGDSPLTEDMYSSTETEEELEQLFNTGINNGRDMEDKDTNQQDRRDEDEKQTDDTSEETVEKTPTNLLCDLWIGVIRRSQVFSVRPVCSCYLRKLQWRRWGFRTESHLQSLCKEESNQHWARRC